MIDLDRLREVANRDGDVEIVTRRWLRQVIRELEEARRTPAPVCPALDFKTLERR